MYFKKSLTVSWQVRLIYLKEKEAVMQNQTNKFRIHKGRELMLCAREYSRHLHTYLILAF